MSAELTPAEQFLADRSGWWGKHHGRDGVQALKTENGGWGIYLLLDGYYYVDEDQAKELAQHFKAEVDEHLGYLENK